MSSAWAKYHWASKHMDAVAAAIERSIDPNAHAIAVDVNACVLPDGQTGESFNGQINDWLTGVPSDYRAIIRRYQHAICDRRGDRYYMRPPTAGR